MDEKELLKNVLRSVASEDSFDESLDSFEEMTGTDFSDNMLVYFEFLATLQEGEKPTVEMCHKVVECIGELKKALSSMFDMVLEAANEIIEEDSKE